MKTVLLSFFFIFGLACLNAQNCVEAAFKFYQDSAYFPLPNHLEACLLTTLQQPFNPNIPEERHSRALALIALSNHYSTPPMLDYSHAERTLTPVLEFLKESEQDDLPYLAEVYNLLGIYYEWLFQLDKAELYAVKSRQIAENLGDLGTMYSQDINLASLYSKTGKYEEGIAAVDRGILGMQKLMTMVEDTNMQKRCRDAIRAGRYNKTVVWSEQSKQQRHNLELAAAQTSIDNTLVESKIVLALVEQLRDTSRAQLVVQQIVGTYYYSLASDAPDSILVYVEHFLRLNNRQTSPFAIGSMTAMRGYALGRQGHLQQALDENTRGLQGMDYPVRDAFDAPPVKVDNVSVARLLLSGIIARAEILYRFYEKDKKANLRYLRAAVALMGRDVEMTQVILRDQQTDEGIIYFQTLVLSTIDIAARYSAELYRATGEAQDFERSFAYSEQAKAFALRNKIRQIDLNVSWQGKAYECWQTELRLQDDIRRYKALLDTNGVFQAQNALKNVLESWQNSSDPEIRHYYQNRYDYTTVKLQQIRSELLDDTTALISYLWMYPKPMAFVITKSHTAVYDLNITETFIQHSRTLIQEALERDQGEPYDVPCKALYDILLGDILKDPAMGNIGRLVFSKDAMLMEIPFEVLLTESPSNLKDHTHYPLLVLKYVIGYEYSATVWHFGQLMTQQKTVKHGGKDRIGVFASWLDTTGPTIPNCDDIILGELRAQATQHIPSLFPSPQTRVFDPAHSEDFQTEQLRDFDILHFVMHTCLCDPTDPFSYALMFSNDKMPNQLRIADIYTRKLGAKMAVMGSCDTQKGQNRASEGIFGIARALNYAGCPNLIATLNTVTDAPTAAIYRYFYENLAAGKPSDVALTMAKRSYLEHPLPGMDRPYYWANTICIGPPQVIRR